MLSPFLCCVSGCVYAYTAPECVTLLAGVPGCTCDCRLGLTLPLFHSKAASCSLLWVGCAAQQCAFMSGFASNSPPHCWPCCVLFCVLFQGLCTMQGVCCFCMIASLAFRLVAMPVCCLPAGTCVCRLLRRIEEVRMCDAVSPVVSSGDLQGVCRRLRIACLACTPMPMCLFFGSGFIDCMPFWRLCSACAVLSSGAVTADEGVCWSAWRKCCG